VKRTAVRQYTRAPDLNGPCRPRRQQKSDILSARSGERLQGRVRIRVAAHAGHARGKSPDARTQGSVEGRATRLCHPRAPVGEDHVVHEQVAEDDEVGDSARPLEHSPSR
jgi:hypothetical protein